MRSSGSNQHAYVKFLAFLKLANADAYHFFSFRSNNADLVKAQLIATNERDKFKLDICSSGKSHRYERFAIEFDQQCSVTSAWDWRWINKISVVHEEDIVLAITLSTRILDIPYSKRKINRLFLESIGDHVYEIMDHIRQSEENEMPLDGRIAYARYVMKSSNM